MPFGITQIRREFAGLKIVGLKPILNRQFSIKKHADFNNANSPKYYKLSEFAGLKIVGPKSEVLNPTIFNKNNYRHFILGCDVGGTNTRIGFFGINNHPKLLISFHFKSRELKNLSDAINKVLGHIKRDYGIKITESGIAAAGPLSSGRNKVKITNIEWGIDKNDLLKKTKLKKIMLLNDFEAIGYGINMLNRGDIKIIKKSKKIPNAPIVLIGAGTGLGRSTLIYDAHLKSYIPIASEAGHIDFSAKNEEEFDLIDYIKKKEKLSAFVSFEHFLSGHGLVDIYYFLRHKDKSKTKYAKEIDAAESKPELISKYRKIDKTCRKTFTIFQEIYARFARNCALDCLPYGGFYITGKIAVNNSEIFNQKFTKEFERNYKLSYILKRVPIYVILNYNVGMLGAAFAYHIQSKKSPAL